MSKDTSLEEIDIAKLLIYILIFIVVCLAMIFGFIIPNIKEYREIQYQNRAQNANVSKINQIYTTKNTALNDMQEKDGAIFRAYETKFNEDNFKKFASGYFSDVRLGQIKSETQNEPFLRYELNVTSLLKTPIKFYDFIDGLSKYENIVKVDFPIKMHGDGEKIHTTFNIKIYGLN